MHILLSILFLFVQFFVSYNFQIQGLNQLNISSWREIIAHINDSNIDVDTEELVYNGKVYFDEIDWDVDVSTDTIETDQSKTDKAVVIDNIDTAYNNTENVQSLEESEEEEIIFHDDFDTWYREDLEEIWNE